MRTVLVVTVLLLVGCSESDSSWRPIAQTKSSKSEVENLREDLSYYREQSRLCDVQQEHRWKAAIEKRIEHSSSTEFPQSKRIYMTLPANLRWAPGLAVYRGSKEEVEEIASKSVDDMNPEYVVYALIEVSRVKRSKPVIEKVDTKNKCPKTYFTECD